MKTLTLSLKKQWFDMIKSGEKKEEYRSLNEYWIKRLLKCTERDLDHIWSGFCAFPHPSKMLSEFINEYHWVKYFDRLVFTLGYPKAGDTERRLTFKNPKIRIGTGRPEWGAEPGVNYFCITWGEE